jgi:hypothetical protein
MLPIHAANLVMHHNVVVRMRPDVEVAVRHVRETLESVNFATFKSAATRAMSREDGIGKRLMRLVSALAGRFVRADLGKHDDIARTV